jgi:hypothetical protein
MLKPLMIAGLVLTVSSLQAAPRYSQNEKGQVTSIVGLSDSREGCHPSEMSGVVVKREFQKDEISLSGIVVELPDGTRSFINVIAVPESLPMAQRSNFVTGLQILTKVGRTVSLLVDACGAAGRMLLLDAIK